MSGISVIFGHSRLAYHLCIFWLVVLCPGICAYFRYFSVYIAGRYTSLYLYYIIYYILYIYIILYIYYIILYLVY